MRHPPQVWSDPSYAEEPLERLRADYLTYLRGRAQPVSARDDPEIRQDPA